MRRWEKLSKEYGSKGLHFISAYTQFHTLEVVEDSVKKLGLTLPVAMDGYWDTRFQAKILCEIWVIGVDGKIIYADENGWEEAALEELKKVKYPGLGRSAAKPELEPAAKAFCSGDWAKAVQLAEAVSEGDHSDEVLADAEAIMDRVRERRKLLENRAETAEVCGDFALAQACWSELAQRIGDVVDERSPTAEVKRIAARKDFAAEAKARREFMDARLRADIAFEAAGSTPSKAKDSLAQAIKLMEDFVSANKDRLCATAANDLIRTWKSWQDEADKKDEPKKSK